MEKIYFTSDLHFGHDREFIWKPRGFNSIDEMNEAYVERWNSTLDNDDDIYVLGDLMLGSADNIKYLERLNGRIHIVLGNHDTDNRAMLYKKLPHVVKIAGAGIRLTCRDHHFIMTHYPMLTGNLEKESLKHMWLNLYGHTHQTSNFYNDMPYCYHVGVDSHNGFPVAVEEILDEMYSKVLECKSYL